MLIKIRARPNGARKAWFLAEEIRKRTDDAPVLGSNIRTKYLKAVSAQAKANVPRSSYIKKIMEFQNTHYNRGKLYWEYLKQGGWSVKGTLCSFWQENTWTGIETTRISQPMPSHTNPGLFLPASSKPLFTVKVKALDLRTIGSQEFRLLSFQGRRTVFGTPPSNTRLCWKDWCWEECVRRMSNTLV